MTIFDILKTIRSEIPVIVEKWNEDLCDYDVIAHGSPLSLMVSTKLSHYWNTPFTLSVVDRPDPYGDHRYITTIQLELEEIDHEVYDMA